MPIHNAPKASGYTARERDACIHIDLLTESIQSAEHKFKVLALPADNVGLQISHECIRILVTFNWIHVRLENVLWAQNLYSERWS
jgi:hypothetical protein